MPLPGWRARGRVCLCRCLGVPCCSTHVQRRCVLDGQWTDRCRASRLEQLQTSHDRAGVAVAFCAVEPEDCGLWTVDSEASRLPSTQQCPHAAAG